MEMMTLIWILVVVLAVIHGVVSAFHSRNTPTARMQAAASEPSKEVRQDDEDEHLGALELMARDKHGLRGTDKDIQVWGLHNND